jgi:hypothetical protein
MRGYAAACRQTQALDRKWKISNPDPAFPFLAGELKAEKNDKFTKFLLDP